MQIQIISDIHLEIEDDKTYHIEGEKSFYEKIVPSADILVIAGDLCPLRLPLLNDKFKKWAKTKWKRIIRVTGNHEYWGGVITKDNIYNDDGQFITLSQGIVKYGDVTFICATGWGDLTTNLRLVNAQFCDYFQIYPMDYKMYNEMGKKHRKFITDTVQKTEGKIVIVTHHMPSFSLIDLEYADSGDINYFFAMDYDKFLEEYQDKIDCWVYGHSHMFNNEIINGVRTIRNPYGYPMEDSLFKPNYIIEV